MSQSPLKTINTIFGHNDAAQWPSVSEVQLKPLVMYTSSKKRQWSIRIHKLGDLIETQGNLYGTTYTWSDFILPKNDYNTRCCNIKITVVCEFEIGTKIENIITLVLKQLFCYELMQWLHTPASEKILELKDFTVIQIDVI